MLTDDTVRHAIFLHPGQVTGNQRICVTQLAAYQTDFSRAFNIDPSTVFGFILADGAMGELAHAVQEDATAITGRIVTTDRTVYQYEGAITGHMNAAAFGPCVIILDGSVINVISPVRFFSPPPVLHSV